MTWLIFKNARHEYGLDAVKYEFAAHGNIGCKYEHDMIMGMKIHRDMAIMNLSYVYINIFYV